MQIEISGNVEENLRKIVKETGFAFKEVIERALMLFYLSAVKEELELKKEFDDLEKASDEDFENFEKTL